jgi:hypothetical protein
MQLHTDYASSVEHQRPNIEIQPSVEEEYIKLKMTGDETGTYT